MAATENAHFSEATVSTCAVVRDQCPSWAAVHVAEVTGPDAEREPDS